MFRGKFGVNNAQNVIIENSLTASLLTASWFVGELSFQTLFYL